MASYVITFFEKLLHEQDKGKIDISLIYFGDKYKLRIVCDDGAFLHDINNIVANHTGKRARVRSGIYNQNNIIESNSVLEIDEEVITLVCQKLELNFTSQEIKKELKLKGVAPKKSYAVNQCKFTIDFSLKVKEELTRDQFWFAYLEKYSKETIKNTKSHMLNNFGQFKTMSAIYQYATQNPGTRTDKTIRQLTFTK